MNLLSDFVGIVRINTNLREFLLQPRDDAEAIDSRVHFRLERCTRVTKFVFFVERRCGRVYGATRCRDRSALVIVSKSADRLCEFGCGGLREMFSLSRVKHSYLNQRSVVKLIAMLPKKMYQPVACPVTRTHDPFSQYGQRTLFFLKREFSVELQ